MLNVKLYSVQKVEVLGCILDGKYKPKRDLGFGSSDEVSRRCYNFMRGELEKKLGTSLDNDEGLIWSWYVNPFLVGDYITGGNTVVVEYEIDSSKVLFSDYDLWCDMLLDEKTGINPFVDLSEIGMNSCIQAVTRGIPKSSIKRVFSVNEFKRRLNSLEGRRIV